MKKLFILFLFSLSFNYAQTQNLKFTHITTDDGLSQSNVKCILQDHLGFMWFGTFDGLDKYNGYNFKVYKSDQDDSTSLLSNSVSSLYEDENNIIWIGTDQGLCIYNPYKDIFKSFRDTSVYPAGVTHGEINSITEDKNKNIWIATSLGLVYYDRQEKSFHQFLHDPNDPNSLADSYAKAVFKDSNGKIWIGTTTGGLNLLNPDGKTFTKFSIVLPNGKFSQKYEIRTIKEDNNGTLWIGTYGYGLGYINLNNINNKTLSLYSHDPNNNQSISSNLILSLWINKDGSLWIGTENGGVNYLAANSKTFIHYQNNPDLTTSLNNNSIWSIYKDRAGDLWFGTYAGGIDYVNKTDQALMCYRSIPGNVHSLSANTVRDFTEDKDGNLWIATDGGGLNLFNTKTKLFTHYSTSNTNLDRDAIIAIFMDHKDNIWVGTWDGGISLFNRKNHSFKSYTKDNSSIQSNNVFDIDEDNQGRFWLATTEGLILFNPEKESFKLFNHANASLPADHMEDVLVDSKGYVLCGTIQGLAVFDPNKEKVIYTYKPDPKSPQGLSAGFVTVMYQESPSIIWAGTINGLNKIDRNNKTVKKYYEKDGLPNNSIRGILPGNSGNIWLSTNHGLSKFNPKKETFKNYGKLDGIQGNEYVINSCYKTREGKLLFGGVNGFDYFDPSQVKDNNYIPPVVITNFQIFNKNVKPGIKNSPLKKDISETHQIILSYKQSVFSFQFTALNYRSSAKNKYAYMLKGFDKDWNYVGTKRSASYTNLDPGKYVFMVKGSNNDGIWNKKGTSLNIIITPPFWATWWFRLLILVLIAGIIYVLWKRAINKRRSLEEINKKLADEIKHNKDAEEEKLRLAAEARAKDDEAKKALEEQQEYLQKGFDLLLAQMNRFSEGDLSVNIDTNNADSFSRLFSGFNKAVESFKKIIINLFNVVESTAAASNQINTSADKISEGTAEQLTRSQEVVTAISQMTANINDSSKNSERAAKSSIEAKKVAEEGGNIVKQTIDSMSEINNVVNNAASTIQKLGDSSNEIGDIILLIEEIADQTNLLALNASIEAARAGEHGRGFAVVADEVQRLSERTTSATKDIAKMIKKIQVDSTGAIESITAGLEKVNTGREYATNAGASLDKIIDSVSNVSQVIEQVAAANEEQSATAEHINQSIVNINDVSKNNADRAKQVLTAIENLRKLTLDLQEIINKFETGSGNNGKQKHLVEYSN